MGCDKTRHIIPGRFRCELINVLHNLGTQVDASVQTSKVAYTNTRVHCLSIPSQRCWLLSYIQASSKPVMHHNPRHCNPTMYRGPWPHHLFLFFRLPALPACFWLPLVLAWPSSSTDFSSSSKSSAEPLLGVGLPGSESASSLSSASTSGISSSYSASSARFEMKRPRVSW